MKSRKKVLTLSAIMVGLLVFHIVAVAILERQIDLAPLLLLFLSGAMLGLVRKEEQT